MIIIQDLSTQPPAGPSCLSSHHRGAPHLQLGGESDLRTEVGYVGQRPSDRRRRSMISVSCQAAIADVNFKVPATLHCRIRSQVTVPSLENVWQ